MEHQNVSRRCPSECRMSHSDGDSGDIGLVPPLPPPHPRHHHHHPPISVSASSSQETTLCSLSKKTNERRNYPRFYFLTKSVIATPSRPLQNDSVLTWTVFLFSHQAIRMLKNKHKKLWVNKAVEGPSRCGVCLSRNIK